MNYILKKNGFIDQIHNNDVHINFYHDNLYVVTDKETFNLNQIPYKEENGILIFETEKATFTLKYKNPIDTNFIKRRLTITFNEPTDLLKVGCDFDAREFDEVFLYDTYYNASGAVFARKGDTGFAIGFENPFFTLNDGKIEFEPYLCLKEGEKFSCDYNFIGAYKLYGEKVRPLFEDSQNKPNGRGMARFRCPGEGYDLYMSEIYEMNAYTKKYFKVKRKEFLFTSYNYYSNLPFKPETEDEIELYNNHIDNFVSMGGDAIILNPLCDAKIPTEDKDSYWELFPENTPAWDIYTRAKQKGLKIGSYMGVKDNEGCDNSAFNNYSDNPKWKKKDIKGNLSEENCICCEEYADWYFQVMKNTIRKYKLSIWTWNPGPGNGSFCFNSEHGHMPGKGAYKGFRETLQRMRDLKDEFPDLYIISFNGLKEYGFWGFKYVDQTEGFQEYDMNMYQPLFPEISPDRYMGDVVRFQGNINYLYRFMPYAMNFGLSHRVFHSNREGCENCDKLFDRNGYKFALISAVAAGGSVVAPIIPRKPELIPGYMEFYKSLISWAKKNWEYSLNTMLFNNLENFGGEAYSKLINNEGYLFIVNPYPMPIDYSFVMDNSIGYNYTEEKVNINYLWPMKEKYVEDVEFKEQISVVIPPYSIIILEVTKEKKHYKQSEMRTALPRFLNVSRKKKNSNIYNFFGDGQIKIYIEEQKKYIFDEVLRAGEEFCDTIGFDASHWYRNDRLWLQILNCKEMPSIRLNNLLVYIKPFKLEYNGQSEISGYFADVTDMIIWNKNNVLEFENTDVNNNPWLFFTYPRPEYELPNQLSYSVIKEIPQAPKIDKSIVITEGKLNSDNIMLQNDYNIISCKLNVPYEELEGVYASCPISSKDPDLICDMALEYDNGIWTKTFKVGSRKDIVIDDDKIVLWAVTKDQRESKSYKFPINWIL